MKYYINILTLVQFFCAIVVLALIVSLFAYGWDDTTAKVIGVCGVMILALLFLKKAAIWK